MISWLDPLLRFPFQGQRKATKTCWLANLSKSGKFAYLFPHSVKTHYFCCGPISVDPICPQPSTKRDVIDNDKRDDNNAEYDNMNDTNDTNNSGAQGCGV